MQHLATGELLQEIKRSLSTIKISGMREDNTKEFYKEVLSDSKPYKFYLTYPDGHGDMALIFTRITQDEKIRFVSIVVNIETGIKDCFGFFEISKFECSKILERFLRDEKTVDIDPESFKTILYNAEMTTIKSNHNNWKLPYEYVCWKNLLIDIDFDNVQIETILSEQVVPAKVDKTIISTLDEMKISVHWFLDCNYSDEFTILLKELKDSPDLNELVENNLEKVFYKEEKNAWEQKILMAAYIKFVIGKENEAQQVYGLFKDDEIKQELYKNILKRSIYEYLMVIKYDKSIDSNGLTIDEIDNKIKFIEETWVK